MITAQLIILSTFYFISVLPYTLLMNKKVKNENIIGLSILGFMFTTIIYIFFFFISMELILIKNKTHVPCPEYEKIENVYKLKEKNGTQK